MISYQRGRELLAHLEAEYNAWFNSLSDTNGLNNWYQFVSECVDDANGDNRSEEYLLQLAKDNMNGLEDIKNNF